MTVYTKSLSLSGSTSGAYGHADATRTVLVIDSDVGTLTMPSELVQAH